MGTFRIKEVKTDSQYDFVNDNLIVYGKFVKNSIDGGNEELQRIDGACYYNEDGNPGALIGSFVGTPLPNGEIGYELSRMSRREKDLVWDAIDEIEPNILDNGTNTGEE